MSLLWVTAASEFDYWNSKTWPVIKSDMQEAHGLLGEHGFKPGEDEQGHPHLALPLESGHKVIVHRTYDGPDYPDDWVMELHHRDSGPSHGWSTPSERGAGRLWPSGDDFQDHFGRSLGRDTKALRDRIREQMASPDFMQAIKSNPPR